MARCPALQLLAVLLVPGSTAASAVFIGAPPMKLFELQRFEKW